MMMMMMIVVLTTMFIACLIKKQNKTIIIMIACVQSMKCDNLFIDSWPVCCISWSHPVFNFTSAGPASEPGMLLCVKHRVVDRCMFYRLLNAYVFSVSAPQMPFPVWERSCDFRLPNVACSVLLASPFQWSWHLLRSTRIVLLAILFPLTGRVLLYY